MKIAIVTSVYYPQINGVAVFSHNLAMGLASRGHEVLVLTPRQVSNVNSGQMSDSDSGVRVKYLKSKKVYLYPDQIHDVPKGKKRFYKNSLRVSLMPNRQVSKTLNEFKPDAIHVQGSDPVGVAAIKYARKHGVPLVMTEHNQPEVLTESLPLFKFLKKPANKFLENYFRKHLKKADYVTMPTKLAIRHLFKNEKLDVPIEAVSNGVDLTKFKLDKCPEHIYNIYNMPTDAPIILYIGRLDPEKRIDVVLSAFSQFLDKHKLDNLSKTLLVVVGDGTDKNRLVSISKNLGVSRSVKFLGRVVGDDLYNIYRVGDVFATASEIETQGIVLIEAAATGLPLVAVDAGAVGEVCQDGKNGFLLKPGDVSGMAEAFEKILTDKNLKNEMGKKSVEVAAEHSLEKTLDKFIQIYEKLIKKYSKSV